MEIRNETADDERAIHAVVADAFGRRDEADLVDHLRRDGVLVISMVAENDGRLCAHVALSRLVSPPHALALAPVSVITGSQNRGIGTRLVSRAIERARTENEDMIFVLGHRDYYQRFGFSAKAAADFPSGYAGPNFMALHLSDKVTRPAQVIYAPAFDQL
ncbi:MAG: GNAT family N-acetyltransferase [Hyphomicrobiaceae bacterium]